MGVSFARWRAHQWVVITARIACVGVLLAIAPVELARAATPGGPDDLHRSLHEAGVVLDTGCSGVVAESQQLILTARHCIKSGQWLKARLSTGVTRTAWVVAVNEASDQAVLFLEEPAHVEPLSIARREQIPGTVLYFEGNPSRPRFQTARLERIDRCPSLPNLPNALFTGIEGVPGDSGAPLVDAGGRVVGLVHGGAHCHIATPADTLRRLVDGIFERQWVDPAKDGKPTTLSRRDGAALRTVGSASVFDLLPEPLRGRVPAFAYDAGDVAIERDQRAVEPALRAGGFQPTALGPAVVAV
jgi:S1-C subfamily serine protease